MDSRSAFEPGSRGERVKRNAQVDRGAEAVGTVARKVSIGPETFTLAADCDGKVYSMKITPLHEGALAGPPGFYKGIGGKLPF